jgi:hypothetical protein
MPIIKNNLYYHLTTETATKPVSAAKIQLDVLDNCSYNCSGCFVNKKNNAPTAEHMKDFAKFFDEISSSGVLVDDIVIGPTDFLSSGNLFDVLSNPDLLRVINENAPVLTFISTLKEKGRPVKEFADFMIEHVNIDTEIEINIATSPQWVYDPSYINMIKSQLNLFDKHMPHDVTYTFALNIDEYDIDYADLHEHIVNEFFTTLDLIPSIARSKIKPKMISRINHLNDYYNNLPIDSPAHNIMIDHSHGGINYQVFNFKRGLWYTSPFLYENMVIYDDIFKIDSMEDAHNKMVKQYAYESECQGCEFINSCASRNIIMLMEFLGETSCICPKENMVKNKYTSSKAVDTMYDWEDYTVDSDKNGYRKKFVVHDDNIQELKIINEVYYNRK